MWPVELHLLGPWDSLQCFPLLHGHGPLSLVHYEVSEVRRRLSTLTARQQVSVPVGPAVWRPPPSGAQGQGSAIGGSQPASGSHGGGALMDGPSTSQESPVLSWLEAAEADMAHDVRARLPRRSAASAPKPPPWAQPSSQQGNTLRDGRHDRRDAGLPASTGRVAGHRSGSASAPSGAASGGAAGPVPHARAPATARRRRLMRWSCAP